MAPCAIGTDTGGSVRIPAAWCGITGLKTTIGRISTHGVLPLSHTLDTPGPLTRSVEDCALLLALLQGADPHDPLTVTLPPSDPMPALKRGVKGLRLARMPDSERTGVEAEVLAAYDRALTMLAGMGAQIVDLPRGMRSFRENGDLVGRIISAEVYPRIAALADDSGAPLDEAVRPAGAGPAREFLRGEYRGILAERIRPQGRICPKSFRHRCGADAQRADAADSIDGCGPDPDPRHRHPLGKLSGPLRLIGAERPDRERPADLAADHLPGRR